MKKYQLVRCFKGQQQTLIEKKTRNKAAFIKYCNRNGGYRLDENGYEKRGKVTLIVGESHESI